MPIFPIFLEKIVNNERKIVSLHSFCYLLSTMNEKNITQQRARVVTLLKQRHIVEAFVVLEQLSVELGDWTLRETFEQHRNTYRALLQYAINGIDDPHRTRIYNSLLLALYSLTDAVAEALLTRYSSRLPYAEKRRIVPSLAWIDGLKNAADDAQYDAAEVQLFESVWLSECWSEQVAQSVAEEFASEVMRHRTKCVLMSAVTLSALRMYDARKLTFLLQCVTHPEVEVRMRAVVGVLLLCAAYDDRILLDDALLAHIDTLCDNPQFVGDTKLAFLSLVRTTETESVAERIRSEIIPDMMRLSPKIKSRLENEALRDDAADDRNPDWQQLLDEAGITDKLQELSELQMEGADIYAATFANLKSFPFFGKVINWLLPFDSAHGAVTAVTGTSSGLFAKLLSAPQLCDSDKYSFCLCWSMLPETQRRMMLDGMVAESEQMKEMLAEATPIHPELSAQSATTRYVQNLYRFYTLHPHRADFENPLSATVAFYASPLFGRLFRQTVVCQQIAEFYFAKNLYAEAAIQFETLVAAAGADAALLQKSGYCYQRLDMYDKALAKYRLADTCLPDNLWTLRRMAWCHRRLAQPAEALAVYRRYDRLRPDDFNVILQMGHCLVQLQRYKEAVEVYFRADNLQPDAPASLRAVAWCYLLDGQFDKSIYQYRKVTQQQPIAADWLNLAHACYLADYRGEAVAAYASARKAYGSAEAFRVAFDNDRQTLEELGAQADKIAILREYLELSALDL